MIERYSQVFGLVLPGYGTPVEGDLCGVYREAASRFAREEHRCALLGVNLDPPEAEPLAQQVERLLESTCNVALFGIGRKESGIVGELGQFDRRR
ncbi:jg1174 [Pararge aegeria aegeria]|uniref:Jg1174 protein n=1 Tax=Pararge aegeria aegeria TaxID=348720 RepID=A0A8S4QJY5_9NEOP|nr:jg1174 [Pararge aegeria aegeria]